MELPIIIDLRPEHPWKEYAPRNSTESGIVAEIKLTHPLNALFPIYFKASPKDTDSRDMHPPNVLSLI